MYVKVAYTGTDIGQLYLGDIGRRTASNVAAPRRGQDQYINPGETIFLVATSDVLLSMDRGSLKKFADAGSLVVTTQANLVGAESTTVKQGVTVQF